METFKFVWQRLKRDVIKKLNLWNYGICQDFMKEQYPRGPLPRISIPGQIISEIIAQLQEGIGSRVHTDRFPKQPLKGRTLLRGVLGHAPPGNLMDFLKLPKVPFPGFLSHSDRMLASSILLGWSLATWKVLSLLKTYLLWKVWPIFVNRWKPVWIRAWVML